MRFPGGAWRNEAEVSDARIPFVRTGRPSYIDLTRHDQLIRRDVAKAINGFTEFVDRSESESRRILLRQTGWFLFFHGFDPHFESDPHGR